jgi:hypothetical protein
VAVLGIVSFDEVGRSSKRSGFFFERVAGVGPVTVEPDFLRPRVLAGLTIVEEQDVVRDDNGSASRRLEHRADVLDEVELLIRRRRPRILAVVGGFVGLLLVPFTVTMSRKLSLTHGWISRR